MEYKKIILMYFSPGGTTKKTLENIAKGMDAEKVEHLDLTNFDKRWERRVFEKDEFVLFGMPAYFGRMTPSAKEIFNRTLANNTSCVSVVVYGNRAYEDSLLELKNSAEDCGFKVIGAAAFVAEHSFNNGVAVGRPDESDTEKQIEFGREIAKRLGDMVDPDNIHLEVPGDFPYKNAMDPPIAATADDKCINCGKCVENCPVKAIDPNDPKKTDKFRCILCNRCIKDCPEGAREIRVPHYQEQVEFLTAMAQERREPEIFFDTQK
ncbi:MAG: 4Fe-4S binding protein [Spirochaetales bacterium]|nr:4Fe-4S binding protein [Spirochaetales bacterium]